MSIPAAPNRWVLVIVIALAPLLGWAKVEYQREHPPEWSRKPIHQYEGYVSIDGFAQRAAQVREVLRGEDPGARKLAEALRRELHPTSLLVPFLVGALALLTGSVPIAFMLVNLAVYGLSLWLIARIARRQLTELGIERAGSCAAWSMLVFAAHVDTSRTAIQLHVDFAVACLGLAVVLAALDVFDRQSGARRLGLIPGLHLLGMFSKFSFAPFLAVLPVAAWLSGSTSKRWGIAALSIAVPLAVVAAFTMTLGGEASPLRDVAHFKETWRLEPGQVSHFAVEFALALQWLPLVLFIPRWGASRVTRLVGVVVALYLAALLCFGLPAVPRLYLPAIALLSALCVPFLLAVAERSGTWSIYAWLTLNLLLAVLGVRQGS